MIIVALVLLGLIFGSFVNALVWRVHEQAEEQDKKKPNRKRLKELSVMQGRSMCIHCGHTLAAKDLVPLFSWLSTRGKCRYCHKPIGRQYPVVELATAILFVVSYLAWPHDIVGREIVSFGLWLALVTGFMALTVYDIRWYLLPNRMVYPLTVVAALLACVEATQTGDLGKAALDTALAVVIGGGIFYVLFQVSQGKWIGGGDVKLGWLLGLVVMTPGKALLFIFAASVLGTLVSAPLLAKKKMKADSIIPFGPFLIAGAFFAVLWGQSLLDWYQRTFINI